MTEPRLDVVLVNPGGREIIDHRLGAALTAISHRCGAG